MMWVSTPVAVGGPDVADVDTETFGGGPDAAKETTAHRKVAKTSVILNVVGM